MELLGYADDQHLYALHLDQLAIRALLGSQTTAAVLGLWGYFCPSWLSPEQANIVSIKQLTQGWVVDKYGQILCTAAPDLLEKSRPEGAVGRIWRTLPQGGLDEFPLLHWGAHCDLRKLQQELLDALRSSDESRKPWADRLQDLDLLAPVWALLDLLKPLGRQLEMNDTLASLDGRSSLKQLRTAMEEIIRVIRNPKAGVRLVECTTETDEKLITFRFEKKAGFEVCVEVDCSCSYSKWLPSVNYSGEVAIAPGQKHKLSADWTSFGIRKMKPPFVIKFMHNSSHDLIATFDQDFKPA